MPSLFMTKGLPASGKTTAANKMASSRKNHVVVCKDDIRAMLHAGQKWTGARERAVVAGRDALVSTMLERNLSVIVADTNLAPKHEARLTQLAREHNAHFEVVDLTHVPLHTCLQRDRERGQRGERSVGEYEIRRMHERFIRPTLPKFWQDPTLPPCILVDLDGTLADISWRNPYDASDCAADPIKEPAMFVLLQWLGHGNQAFIHSGRSEKYLTETMEWLHHLPGGGQSPLSQYLSNGQLVVRMRPEHDQRRDSVFKRDLLTTHIAGKYQVKFCLDDRQQVVDEYRDLGLEVLAVADGNF